MRKTLQPKPSSRNIDVMNERLAAYANGWSPMPCEGKAGVDEGWPTREITEAVIRGWDTYKRGAGSKYLGTGIRLEGSVFIVDLDIKDVDIMNAVLARIDAAHPVFYAGAIWRNSGAVSLALIGQISDQSALEKKIKSRTSRLYGRRTADGKIVDAAHVEVHTGLAKRYFAVSGPHKIEGRFYQCEGASPFNTRLDALPVFPAEKVGELIDTIEVVLAEHLEVIDSGHDSGDIKRVYDLTPETQFQIHHGDVVTAEDLESLLDTGAADGVYGVMEFDWGKSDSGTRHHAFVRDTNGRLMITDHYRDVNHYWVDEEPGAASADVGEVLRQISEQTAEPDPGTPEREAAPIDDIPRDQDPIVTYANATLWLIQNMAYYTQAFNGRGGCVSIHPNGEFLKPVTVASLRGRMTPYSYTSAKPRKQHNPVDYWMAQPTMLSIDDIRMRPELPRPYFMEGVQRLLNRYLPPVHPTKGGSIVEFTQFLVRFIPDPLERAWAWNWLASKVQHPEWRMVGLAMVAREMGTGRGLLAETLQYLFGARFVMPLPYSKLSGGAGSRFNAEVVDKLVVFINESRDAEDRKFAHKNAAREALKDFIEPNHRLPFRVEPKGVDAYTTRAAISTLMFTNNIDGLPIGEGDRRVTVVLNGPQLGVRERERYQAWMLDPLNIGALWRALAAHAVEADRSIFDPYMPPEFHGRDLMIEAGKTAIDMAWEQAVAKVGTAAELYTMSQIVEVTRYYAKSTSNDFDDLVRKHTVVNGHRIGTKHSTNWLVRYGAGEDNRERVYALDEVGRKRWSVASPGDIKQQLDRAQQVVDAPRRSFSKVLRAIEGGLRDE